MFETMPESEALKPRFRGVSHQYAFFVSIITGLVLVLKLSPDNHQLGPGIFALALSSLLGTSALYHRVKWKKETTQAWMRRLDHTMIFVLIAGTFTPFAMANSGDPQTQKMLKILWGAVAVGMLFKLFWVTAPRWITAGSYVVVGSLGGLCFPSLLEKEGPFCVGLLVGGGVVYIIGALVYAMKRPNPWPKSYGYHEIFHALVIVGASLHYSAVAVLI